MMKKRLIVRFTSLTIFLLAIVAIYKWRYPLIGFLRNEPFYDHQPLSYWKARIKDEREVARNRQSTWGRWLNALAKTDFSDLDFKEEDPEAQGMVLILATDADPDIRLFAISLIGSFKSPTDDELVALVGGLEDSDWSVRIGAINATSRLGPKARIATPALISLLDDEDFPWAVIKALLNVDPVEAQKQGIPLDFFDEKKNDGSQYLRFRIKRLQDKQK